MPTLVEWLRRQLPMQRGSGVVTATFIVDCQDRLWIADRRSEHVACADGGPVLAAGEIQFSMDRGEVEVTEISNQSTGFCPEPECWAVVARVLDLLGVRRPETWTHAFDFRRCSGCFTINTIKEGFFECAVCGATLPAAWNLCTDCPPT